MNDLPYKQLGLLYVDDDRAVLAHAYSLFSPIFKSIHIANDVDLAMDIFAKETIDIIITDIELPKGDGFNLIETLRSHQPDLPVIILSGYDTKEYLMKAANSRIDGFLIKPLSADKLMPVIDKIIARLPNAQQKFSFSENLSYCYKFKKLNVDQHDVTLGDKESRLLELFINSPNQVITKAQIAKGVWKNNAISESAMKSLLSELRKKLKYDVITTVPRQGWMIKHD